MALPVLQQGLNAASHLAVSGVGPIILGDWDRVGGVVARERLWQVGADVKHDLDLGPSLSVECSMKP